MQALEFRTAFGRYVAEDKLGEGGSGIVYSASDEDNQKVAIKVLHPSKATRARTKRFKNEYLFGFQNSHPQLVRVLDIGTVEQAKGISAPFYVMPRYSGSLRTLMKTGVDHSQVLSLFARLWAGIEAANLLRVVHRDLKPENVLANNLTDVVISDFGIARFEEEDLYTAVETNDGERMANFFYAAPEQKRRGAAIDQRTDIFALGLILNELLTGEIPQGVGFKTISCVSPALAWLDEIVAQMIQADLGSRPSGVPAVRDLLRMKSDQFEQLQRLSALSKTVVAADTVDDPLAVEPPDVVGADFDGSQVIITLDRPVSDGWVNALRKIGSYRSAMNAGPDRFRFIGNTARVQNDGKDAQTIVDCFKEWLPRATSVYANDIRISQQQQERERTEALRRQRETLAHREKVRASLKI
jgi:serine/threonine protein kinase